MKINVPKEDDNDQRINGRLMENYMKINVPKEENNDQRINGRLMDNYMIINVETNVPRSENPICFFGTFMRPRILDSPKTDSSFCKTLISIN